MPPMKRGQVPITLSLTGLMHICSLRLPVSWHRASGQSYRVKRSHPQGSQSSSPETDYNHHRRDLNERDVHSLEERPPDFMPPRAVYRAAGAVMEEADEGSTASSHFRGAQG